MNTINFFSAFHTGDVFASKEFVRQVRNELTDFNFGYYHKNHPKILKDLDMPYIGPTNLHDFPQAGRYIESRDGKILKINTWIGAFNPRWQPEPPYYFEYDGGPVPAYGTNLISLSCVWGHIFEKINDYFGTSLKLKDKMDYIPTIDYNFFDITSHQKFIEERGNTKKVLFCNGLPMSGQSIPNDMADVINHFAKEYPQYDFICAKKINTTLDNVFFTDDIIIPNDEIYDLSTVNWNDREIGNCDLNEISYLSNHCDLIVGKQSGPFCYCATRENLMNPNKYMIAFSKTADDAIAYGLDIECDYLLSADHDEYCNNTQYVIDTIGEKLCLI